MQLLKEKGVKTRLSTFDRALPFYQKLGYTVYGELTDFPEGKHSRDEGFAFLIGRVARHTIYHLKKTLFD